MSLISIIVPCFNEEDSISPFYKEFFNIYEESLKEFNYELLFIDDGSKDDTLKNIKELSKNDENVKFISFSRNFGKESALYSGLSLCSGDYVAIMDVDLQDPPNLLPTMMNYLQENNYDIVATRRVSRKGEPVIRSFFAKLFYKIINKITDLNLVDGARDYRLMTRQVVDALLELKEYNRFSKGLFNWIGFNTKWIEYENVERIKGETSWSFWSLFLYSLEGIIAFSTMPLHISTIFGVIFSFISFIMIIILVIRKIFFYENITGWTSTICIILLMGGIQLLSIGILGQYLIKTYTEIKNRPLYLIKETNIDNR